MVFQDMASMQVTRALIGHSNAPVGKGTSRFCEYYDSTSTTEKQV